MKGTVRHTGRDTNRIYTTVLPPNIRKSSRKEKTQSHMAMIPSGKSI